SLGPREGYARLARSPIMKPVDDKPVWSIICFFVDAKARHRGVAEATLDGAVRWARKEGITCSRPIPATSEAQARRTRCGSVPSECSIGPALSKSRAFPPGRENAHNSRRVAKRKPIEPSHRFVSFLAFATAGAPAGGRVRRALPHLRSGGDISLRGQSALHARRRPQGASVRAARHARNLALRDRAIGLSWLRQPRRRRCDRRQAGRLLRHRPGAVVRDRR